jgi:hypothetical protein
MRRPSSRYVDWRDIRCTEAAVTVRDGRWPLCEKHKRAGIDASIRNFNEYVYFRAEQRGLLTQAEEFFRVEAATEARLAGWRFPPEDHRGWW